MVKQPKTSESDNADGGSRPAQSRHQRLEQALRDNLKRRKAHARSMATGSATDEARDGSPETASRPLTKPDDAAGES